MGNNKETNATKQRPNKTKGIATSASKHFPIRSSIYSFSLKIVSFKRLIKASSKNTIHKNPIPISHSIYSSPNTWLIFSTIRKPLIES